MFIEYTSPWTGFEITTVVMIGTNCTGCCKSNYHTILATTTPLNLSETEKEKENLDISICVMRYYTIKCWNCQKILKQREMLLCKVLMKWNYTIITCRARTWETIQLKLNKVIYICTRESYILASIVEDTSRWLEDTLSSYLYTKKI